MGFLSGSGRILFASFFLFSAWQELNAFGVDGGPLAETYRPKFDLISNHLASSIGLQFQAPLIETKHLVAAGIALKGIGGILFILGTSLGAYLLLLHLAMLAPIVHDFNQYYSTEFVRNFTQDLALVGALLFFLGLKNLIIQRRNSKKRSPKPKTN